MSAPRISARRRLFASEVVQTSELDCGPAALKCLLDGFGIPVAYARLQQACETDLDGTSIDTIETIAVASGLDAEQIMVPADHVNKRMLPAVVTVRRHGIIHFVVAWRQHGRLLQVMDPAIGRQWITAAALQADLYVHQQRVSAADWRAYAASPEFLEKVSEHLRALRVAKPTIANLVHAATADPGWRALATLDAATRMAAGLVFGGGLRRGRECGQLIQAITRRAGPSSDPYQLVPREYWSLLPDTFDSSTDGAVMCGAVLLRVRGRRIVTRLEKPTDAAPAVPPHPSVLNAREQERRASLAAAWQFIRPDGWLPLVLLTAAVTLAAAGAVVEMLLLRSILEINGVLGVRGDRLFAIGAVLAFLLLLLLCDFAISAGVFRIGRRFELRLRSALLDKLPRLPDSYFHSKPVSDMAQRAHSLDALRTLPDTIARFARVSIQLFITALAIAWLDPHNTLAAAATAILAVVIPLITERMLAERELRQRTHAAALDRHYLDALIGLVPARTHGAEPALRWQHEMLLVEWARSGLQLLRGGVTVEGMQMLLGSSLAAWMVVDFVGRNGRPGGALLLVYWALSLPILGRELATIVRRFPAYVNILGRILEPLRAPDAIAPEIVAPPAPDAPGVAIRFEKVDVRLAGSTVLSGIDLTIGSGEHVAIVGRSGAGKSTLLALLLGSRSPHTGTLLADGVRLEGAALVQLRRTTAWVDPAVHLWNRTLFENLRYGEPPMVAGFASIIETAELADLIEKLPGGLQAPLGEAGGLTSGGEGQRVRFGRALVRPRVRLALLDEPFRGLDRAQRHELLTRSRQVWRDETLLCVTHDIEETLSFPRVLVLDKGKLVEDGDPAALAQNPVSAYAQLLEAERAVTYGLWSDPRWRKWQLRDGQVHEEEPNISWAAQQASLGR